MSTYPSIALTFLTLACASPAIDGQVKTANDPDSDSDEPDEPKPDPQDSGHTHDDSGDVPANDTSEPTPQQIDYRQTGPYSTATSTTTLSASCSAAVQITTPTTSGSWPRLILAHGFMRTSTQMTGWAEHIASWGIEVVTPSLCHAIIGDTDHTENGADMIRWNAALGGGPVVYAGHSAGGLAALIAASNDPDAIGLIGLDLTDADSLGSSASAMVTAPTFALAGMPSSCNSEGNGIAPMRAVSGAKVIRVTDADHCDFENETDWLCTSFCNNTSASFSDAAIQQSVLGLMTAAAASTTGVDSDATEMWWQAEGVFFNELRTAGALTPL